MRQFFNIFVVSVKVERQINFFAGGMNEVNAFPDVVERKLRLGAQAHVRRAGIDRVGAVKDRGFEFDRRTCRQQKF